MVESERHSGFAKLADYAARDRFIRLLQEDPELWSGVYVPESQPTIVFENLSPPQLDRVRALLEGLGHWYEDVQFRTMP